MTGFINVIIRKILSGIVLILSMMLLFSLNVYGYTDVNLYEEKLIFSEDGTLIMTTHDKKATTNIKYQTIGWVIKRYDMPKDAIGQQYVVIPADIKVEYRDDPKDSAYVYCYYYGNKENISNSINNKSSEWKNLLYKYGDYVYIDEIMTVVENGMRCGGLNSDGSSYGEVYYDYIGISGARQWASKENLKTHFDKTVYFPQQIREKKFGYTYTELEKIEKSHSPSFGFSLGEGTKYKSTYDIEQGVPTGSKLYINGFGEDISYNISFIKARVNLKLPVKLIIRYTLKWKGYDGSIKTEIKDVVSWYHVNRSGVYYTVDEIDVDYLSSIAIKNYAFENEIISKEIATCKPKIVKHHSGEYYNHIISPMYKDEYYIDGGEITQMTKNGIKPTIPDIDRQSVVESFVGGCDVMNDYLSINGKVILDNNITELNAPKPSASTYSSVKSIYFSNFNISHNKLNKSDNETTGYLRYKDYYTDKNTDYIIKGLKSVSIHTPICVSGKVIKLDDLSFKLEVNSIGMHRAIKGYGEKNYKDMCDKIYIRFSENVYLNEGSVLKNIDENIWTEWNKDNVYSIQEDNKKQNFYVDIVAVAKNNIALSESWENYIEQDANIDISNYGAYTRFSLCLENEEEETEEETTKKQGNNVVGTH